MIIIIQFRPLREDKSISNPTSHVDPSILSQIPLSFPKLHLEHSHRSFPPLHSWPRSPALSLVPAENLCSLLPSQLSGHFLSPRAPDRQSWATAQRACNVQNQYRQAELPKPKQKERHQHRRSLPSVSIPWVGLFQEHAPKSLRGSHSAQERKSG